MILAPTLFMSAPAEVPADAPAGYWLSVELQGPAARRTAAVQELSRHSDPRAPRDGPLPGEAVGHVPDMHTALRWVTRYSFENTAHSDDPTVLNEAVAPLPGTRIEREYGVSVSALVLTGATAAGDQRAIKWPVDSRPLLPVESTWKGADLIPARAPLFAAPGPVIPPASEAFATAYRKGSLFIGQTFDRCTGVGTARECLRWAQVLARHKNRFTPGYLPAFQVSRRDSWITGESRLPRAQLIASGLEKNHSLFMLVARGSDNQLYRRSIRAPSDGHGFPAFSLSIDGQWATITFSGQIPRTLVLDATLETRPDKR